MGGADPAAYAQAARDKALSRIPSNHSRFAPVTHPTLETGRRVMLAAAGAGLGAETRDA